MRGMYFADFDLVVLKEVILGYRCAVTPTYLRHLLQKHYDGIGVRLFTSKMHPVPFEVQKEPEWTFGPESKTPPAHESISQSYQ